MLQGGRWYSLFLLFLILLPGVPSRAAGLHKILIIGNSYTSENGLNELLEQIARAAGETVEVARTAPSSMNLNDHWFDTPTQQLLDSKAWDLVVLQEFSLIPASADLIDYEMVPAVERFYNKISARGGQVMLLLTWGRRDGIDTTLLGERIRFGSYSPMQDALSAGYAAVGAQFKIPVAPAGLAWQVCRRISPEIELYQSDGSHPNLNGSYLAALALYAEIFGYAPQTVNFMPAGMDAQAAAKIRTAVARVFTRRLSLSAPRARPNARIQLSVTADGLDACRNWSFSLEYDSSCLQLLAVGQGSGTRGWGAITQETVASRIRLQGNAGAAGTPLSGNGHELCTLTFQVGALGYPPPLIQPRFLLDGVTHGLIQACKIERLAVQAQEWQQY